MQDKDTINILISQLLSKDDELRHQRSRLGTLQNELSLLQREQQEGNKPYS